MQLYDTDFHGEGKEDERSDKALCKFPLLLSLVEMQRKWKCICISPYCSCFTFNFWFCSSCKTDCTNETLAIGTSERSAMEKKDVSKIYDFG